MIKSIDDANKTSNLPALEWKTTPQGAATSVWSGSTIAIAIGLRKVVRSASARAYAFVICSPIAEIT
jgi:hypothetical protein